MFNIWMQFSLGIDVLWGNYTIQSAGGINFWRTLLSVYAKKSYNTYYYCYCFTVIILWWEILCVIAYSYDKEVGTALAQKE